MGLIMKINKSVIITCAGIGSRLGLGQTKALVEICKKPLIAWQLELFKNIEDLRIVVGYQSNSLVQEVLKFRKDAIFIYNHNYFNTKTGNSFYLGARHANEYVIEWDGDLLVHPSDAEKLLNLDQEFIAYSDVISDETVFVNLDSQGNVTSFSEEYGDFEWTGPVCIQRNKINYNTENVYEVLTKHLPMQGIKIRAQDIDTYEDYQKAIQFINSW